VLSNNFFNITSSKYDNLACRIFINADHSAFSGRQVVELARIALTRSTATQAESVSCFLLFCFLAVGPFASLWLFFFMSDGARCIIHF